MTLVRGMHPAQAARSGIARTHRTGHWTARASRGSVDAPNGQPARINSAAPCPEHAPRSEVGISVISGDMIKPEVRRRGDLRQWPDRLTLPNRSIRLARDFYVAVRIGAV